MERKNIMNNNYTKYYSPKDTEIFDILFQDGLPDYNKLRPVDDYFKDNNIISLRYKKIDSIIKMFLFGIIIWIFINFLLK